MIEYTPEQKANLHAANDLRRGFPTEEMLSRLDKMLFSKHLSAVEKLAYFERLANDITRFNVMCLIRELDTIIRIRADREKKNKSQQL